MDLTTTDFTFGDRRLVGQSQAKEQIIRALSSGRLSHAYLLTGPTGTGKKAFALAMAEAINGIDNLTDFGKVADSRKSSWLHHPDIHLFMPIPSNVSIEEMRRRRALLAEDPYEIVDFSMRPSLDESGDTKNRKSFYSIKYFRETIKPAAHLTPNEGERSVIILTEIEKMRKESANAFLKLLEEPSKDVMFILTTSHPDQLLPTIRSRCQMIRFSALTAEEVKQGLIEHDDLSEEDAHFLANVSGGNYTMTRFYDIDTLRSNRRDIVNYLRYSYTMDAVNIIDTAQRWQSNHNREGYITLLDMIELLLRDLSIYYHTHNEEHVTNSDQIEAIKNFCDQLPDARINEMIQHVNQVRGMIYQNAQAKIVFTTLAMRFGRLMRNVDPVIPGDAPWNHLPAYLPSQ